MCNVLVFFICSGDGIFCFAVFCLFYLKRKKKKRRDRNRKKRTMDVKVSVLYLSKTDDVFVLFIFYFL